MTNSHAITEQSKNDFIIEKIEPEISLEEKLTKSRTDSKGNSSADEKIKFSSLEKQPNDELKASQSPPKSNIENVNRRSSSISLKGQEYKTIEENKRISGESQEKTDLTLNPSNEPAIENDNRISKGLNFRKRSTKIGNI